jgi:hypothetical protein
MRGVDRNCVAQNMDHCSTLSEGNKPTDFAERKELFTLCTYTNFNN